MRTLASRWHSVARVWMCTAAAAVIITVPSGVWAQSEPPLSAEQQARLAEAERWEREAEAWKRESEEWRAEATRWQERANTWRDESAKWESTANAWQEKAQAWEREAAHWQREAEAQRAEIEDLQRALRDRVPGAFLSLTIPDTAPDHGRPDYMGDRDYELRGERDK